MSEPDPRIMMLLEDIHTSAWRIVNCLRNETLENFIGQKGIDAQDIVARRLTIIGEAAAALLRKYPEFCDQHPEIPLRQARGMRNALVHDYNRIAWQLVWKTANDELPELIDAITPLLYEKR